MLQLGTMYQRFVQTRGALERLSPMLQDANIRDKTDANPLPEARGDIVLEDVGYRVDDKWLLRDINLHIKSGEVIGLVGPTGCGKTVLVNLLARIMDVNEGQVLIDGHNVRDLQLDDLR